MILPDPPQVRATFEKLAASNTEDAVAYLYELGTSSGYIDQDALTKNIHWVSGSPYGDIECTINLAKPEKDPRAIAAAGNALANKPSPIEGPTIPLCDLCWENEEFPGTPEHPAKPGLRIAALTLGGERWGLQYSPYAYFPQHCIALSSKHRPMKINEGTFEKLLDFVDTFPFYFIGANADLPIVGGSILSHDHFQGGRHLFPLMKAPLERSFPLEGFPEVQAGIVQWPASTLRLISKDRPALAKAAEHILAVWRRYSDESCAILAATDEQHNTLNPIVRKTATGYIMDLVLRNNRTDTQHPWGIFHAPESTHHIKKENIGLIEIMGLSILPPRLAQELPVLQRELFDAAQNKISTATMRTRLEASPTTASHASWASDIYARRALEFTADPPQQSNHELHPVIRQETARVFVDILEATGVFKHTTTGKAGWDSFIAELQHR